MIKHNPLYNYLKLVLLVMFIAHYSNISLFYHTHFVDGVVYCHSHFYWFADSSSPVQLPQHTQDELKLIHDYNHFTWSADSDIPQVGKPIAPLVSVFLCPNLVSFKADEVLFTSLRGPPSIIV